MSANAPEIIRRGEIDVIQIENASCSAEVSLFGGQILHWQPSGHKPVLWTSKTTIYDANKPIRGGVPICWPWFGEVEGKVKHGIVRNRLWHLSRYEELADSTILGLSIELEPELNPGPYPHKIDMEMHFGAQLEQKLTFENTTDSPQCFAYGLHNYFRVSHPDNIDIPQLEGSIYYDHITKQHQLVDSGTRDHNGPIDRIYLNEQTATLVDTGFKRTIAIEKTCSQNWVLWNPGSEATALADIHQGGEQEYLCLEVANTTDLSLAPSEQLSIGQKITLETSE